MDDFPSERLWDADPDVCCAAFQLGACRHTEAPERDQDGRYYLPAGDYQSVTTPASPPKDEPF